MNNVIKLGVGDDDRECGLQVKLRPGENGDSAENFTFNREKHRGLSGRRGGDRCANGFAVRQLTIILPTRIRLPKTVAPPNKSGADAKPAVAPMVGLGGNIDRILAEGDVESSTRKIKPVRWGAGVVHGGDRDSGADDQPQAVHQAGGVDRQGDRIQSGQVLFRPSRRWKMMGNPSRLINEISLHGGLARNTPSAGWWMV